MIAPCILIPIYNNKDTIKKVIDDLTPFQLPCIIVDDGSDNETQQILKDQEQHRKWVRVLHHPQNQGKGAAVQSGLRHAHALRYSHAVQIDADGQHNTQDITKLLTEAEAYPNALILGKPIFGEDAPKSRVIGRKISQFWVCLETFSSAIGDPLFGFRVYPVVPAIALINKRRLAARMDFDTDIAVRLYWEGVMMRNVETVVSYPENGLSHFRLIRDNMRISWLHTCLFFGMICHIPQLLRRKIAYTK